ncbi:MAG: hypothetical protein AAF726_20580 [Planctomycetota bacterium]
MQVPLVRSLVVLLAAFALATPAVAQKVARKATECPEHGFKFKAIADLEAIPIDGDRGREALKFSGDDANLIVFAFESEDEEDGEEVEEGRTVAKKKRQDIVEWLRGPFKSNFPGFSEKRAESPDVDEKVEIDDVEARHRRYLIPSGDGSYGIDIWSFPMSHADVHFVYHVREEFDRKWERAATKSAKSFERIEIVEAKEIDTSSMSYEDQLAWAEQEAQAVEGWYAVGTPSKRFVILTNAEKKRFVNEVIDRLEVSRNLYEQDFPPPDDFDAVSVIRICNSREEFQRFSGAGGGVAGYFSPSTVELVLYDNVETNRNSTYAVVSHEAFHQYCHFLFGQSEAHRWFDEGHGDYYGGMKITGKRGKITPKMPAGLDRLSVIREMVREETYKPLEDHLNYNHQQWQTQGPSNVSCYAQSWSVVYMLRQGAEGKVNRKVWKKEYADVIPNYVSTLNDGFQEAYAKIREKKLKGAKARGNEVDPKEIKVNRFDLDPREKDKIWKAAMEASWGQIDLEEFEANWVLYVEKYLD